MQCKYCGRSITNDQSRRKGKEYCNATCKRLFLQLKHQKAIEKQRERYRIIRAENEGFELQECDICGYKFINVRFHKLKKHADIYP